MTDLSTWTLGELEAAIQSPTDGSWVRSAAMEATRRIRALDGSFGWAIEVLKSGGRVARAGWNGKGMFLYLVPGSTFTVNRDPLMSVLGAGTQVDYLPHVDMKTADGKTVPWLASQTDILATDWEEV